MIRGFDLSKWDASSPGVSSITWADVPDEFKFVFIKASEGAAGPDPLAEDHYLGARGRLRGLYHFWRYAVPVETQVQKLQQIVRRLETVGGKMELPVAIDLEDTSAPSGASCRNAIVRMLEEVEKAFGRRPVVYTAGWWTNKRLGNCSWLAKWPLWIADYTYDWDSGPRPAYYPKGLNPDKWTFHQYSDRLEIPGVASAREDGNTFNGTLEQLYAFCGIGPVATLEEKVEALWNAHPELH